MHFRSIFFIIIISLVIVFTAGCGSNIIYESTEETAGEADLFSDTDIDNKTSVINKETVEEEAKTAIFVHVCGAVNDPGVYELDGGSRIHDAIEAAGGANEDADINALNLAMVLTDGEKIYVPTFEEDITESTGGAPGDDKTVNINTADEAGLTAISGIGPSKAAAIVKYREENGPFSSTEDITKVSGIGHGTYEKIKDDIRVR